MLKADMMYFAVSSNFNTMQAVRPLLPFNTMQAVRPLLILISF